MDIEDVKNNLTINTFSKYKLYRMLSIVYDQSPWKVISDLYPNQIKPWELKNTPKGFWEDKENCIMALNWLTNEKLKIDKNDLTYEIVRLNGMKSIIKYHKLSDILNLM